MTSRDRSRSPMCCRSCAECSCDHRGIITRQNEIIARQERQIARVQQDVNNLRAGLRVALERQRALELRELNRLLDMVRKVKDEDDDENRASA